MELWHPLSLSSPRFDGETGVAKRRTPWSIVFPRTLRAFSTDHCTDLAASLTYYGVLSVFPALLALVSILGLIGQGKQGVEADHPCLGWTRPEPVAPPLPGTPADEGIGGAE